MIEAAIVFGLILTFSVIIGIIYLRKGRTSPKAAKIQRTLKQQPTNQTYEQNRKAKRIGDLGEFKIDRMLQNLPEGCKYINDLMIKKDPSSYSQIDHVIISPFGLFVIETKNYGDAKIYGKAGWKNWNKYVGGIKYPMINPVKQNKGHIKALERLLKNFGDIDIYSLISFTRRSELRVDLNLRSPEAPVMVAYDTDILDFIKKKIHLLQLKKQVKMLNSETIDQIYQFLLKENITDPKAREEHINQINKEQLA